jgi:hypothetical protein
MAEYNAWMNQRVFGAMAKLSYVSARRFYKRHGFVVIMFTNGEANGTLP